MTVINTTKIRKMRAPRMLIASEVARSLDVYAIRGVYIPCLISRTTYSNALSKYSSDDLLCPYTLIFPELFLTTYSSDNVSGNELGGQ